MKRRIVICCLAALLLTMCIAVTAQADTTATVKGGKLYMRLWGSFQADIIGVYNTGTKVTVLDMTDPLWYRCEAPDGHIGYMYAQYLTVNGSPSDGPINDGDTVYVKSSNGLGVNLRTGPGTNFTIFGSYAVGTKATVLSSGTNWCYININGVSGFMMTKYLTTKAPPTPAPATTAYVTSKNGLSVQMRTGPGTGYRAIASFPVGQTVTVHSWGSTWSYITAANKTGYMMTKFLDTKKPSPVTPPAGASMVFASNGLPVRLRSGPGTNYSIIGSYQPGTLVTIVQEDSVWDLVKIGNLTGYMMKSYIITGK